MENPFEDENFEGMEDLYNPQSLMRFITLVSENPGDIIYKECLNKEVDFAASKLAEKMDAMHILLLGMLVDKMISQVDEEVDRRGEDSFTSEELEKVKIIQQMGDTIKQIFAKAIECKKKEEEQC